MRDTSSCVSQRGRRCPTRRDLPNRMGFGMLKAKRLSVACGIVGSAAQPAAIFLFTYCSIQPLEAASLAARQKFRADEWITECDPSTRSSAPDCSITVPFWQTSGDPRGSFALVVMLQTGNIGIVGQPPPVRAVLRVDKNPPVECRQPRYCVFPSVHALSILRQLKVGSLILIDVDTEKGSFSFSLTPKGYQAGLAQIHAWGYRTEE
jgi:hypothetical protein